MTRALSSGFLTHLSGNEQNVVELYKISAVGMSLFTYTDSKEDVSYHGLTYKAYPIKRSKIVFSTDLRVDQTNIRVAKNWGFNRAINADLLSGSSLSIVRVNKNNPNEDNLTLFHGEVANISSGFQELELRGQTLDFLNYQIPRREIQVACNWKLYDRFCAVGLTLYQEAGTLSQTSSLGKDLVSSVFSSKSDNYFRQGFIEITTGENDKIKRHVSWHVGETVTVIPPFPFSSIPSGTTFKIAPGCKHDTDDCENLFNNIINYGGYPYTPKQDSAL